MPAHTRMTVGVDLDSDLATIAEEARTFEAIGVDAVWVGETQHHPFLPLVLVAEHTSRLHMGSSVAIAFPRAPHVTANAAWDLAKYSGGRFVLGLGTQVKDHNERRFSVPWGPPGPRLREYVECMRAIWDSWQHGTKPDYQGEYYQYRLTSPFFNPGPIEHPDIPVILSAVTPFNARLAGEVADGIAVHGFSTFRYIREVLLPALHEGARTAGKDASAMRVQGGGFVVTGRDDAEVAANLEATRRQIAFYAASRASSEVMRLHGWEDEAARLHRLSVDGDFEAMPALVTDAMLDAFCVVATWDALPSAMRAKYAGIATQVTLPASPRTPEDAERLANVVRGLQAISVVGAE